MTAETGEGGGKILRIPGPKEPELLPPFCTRIVRVATLTDADITFAHAEIEVWSRERRQEGYRVYTPQIVQTRNAEREDEFFLYANAERIIDPTTGMFSESVQHNMLLEANMMVYRDMVTRGVAEQHRGSVIPAASTPGGIMSGPQMPFGGSPKKRV